MAKPKLALIPATQGSKLYSVLPADGVGDFTFSRGSAATRINKDGLIETVASGVSRLNYPLIDGVVNGCPSHLLEPSKTNLIQYSENIGNSAWGTNAAGVIKTLDISKIAPNGISGVYKIENNTSSSNGPFCEDTVSLSNGSTYTFSVYLYNDGNISNNNSYIYIFDSNNGQRKVFIDASKTNEWYRLSITAEIGASSSVETAGIQLTSGDGDNIYFWGAQLEQGSYPTSYIPNYGTSAGITRAAETANGAGDASTFNDSEGVLMLEISALANDSNIEAISINANNADNRLALFKWNVSNRIQIRVNIAGNTPIDAGVSLSNIKDLNKISLKYKSGDYALWINGFEVYVNSLADTPIGLSNLSFDSNGADGVPFRGNTKQIQYFDSALNDSDLEKITSWTSFTDLANGQTYSIK